MGKVIETGLKIVCDRCDKPKEVIDEKQIEFYKKYSKSKDRDDAMFAFVVNNYEGAHNVSFEYLCPDCVSAIKTYAQKCDKPQGRKGKDDKDPPETKDEPKGDVEEKKEPPAKTEEKKDSPKTDEKKPETPKAKKDPATDDDDIFDT